MAMKRCNNGHFYDSTKHSVCPFCGVQDLDVSVTMPVRNPAVAGGAASSGVTLGRNAAQQSAAPEIDKTVARGATPSDDAKTIGIMRNKMGFEPVVGWLVCVKGPAIGKDFKLKSEKNFIGRGNNMDVCIQADNGISRDNHATVSYNPKTNKFMVAPGDGHGLVYLNGNEVFAPTELHRGDCIEMGETTLAFVPFCGEDFQWQKD